MIAAHPLLYLTDREDNFSNAYVLAIIGAAGYNYGCDHLDRDSEDLYVRHHLTKDFSPLYLRLGMQVKCTSCATVTAGGAIPFDLKRKNYDDLRLTTQPHILVVVTVPKEMQDCAIFGADYLLLRHRAYWMSLRGYPELANDDQASVTVHVPVKQEFTVDALRDLMEQIARGDRP